MPRKVIIDTDIGDDIDDALALALALSSPELEILGVTTVYGRVDIRAKLAAKLLKAYKKQHIPVARGFSKPIINPEPNHLPYYGDVVSDNEIFPNIVDRHAIDLIEEIVESEKEVTLITIGAMTNAAIFLLKNPHLKSRIKIISMAGYVYYPKAEYNITCDPEAAHIVLSSGVDVTLVPLDVTLKCRMTADIFNRFFTSKKEEVSVVASYIKSWRRYCNAYPLLHDPLAITVSFNEEVVKLRKENVSVELRGKKSRALTIPGQGEKNVRVAYEVDVEKFLRIFEEKILG